MEGYIHRAMSEAIIEASRYFPVVTLTGPRQSGKSTLLRHLIARVFIGQIIDRAVSLHVWRRVVISAISRQRSDVAVESHRYIYLRSCHWLSESN